MPSIDQLRRDAKTLKRAFAAGETRARQRVQAVKPRDDLSALKHADFLHIIAREQGFGSWPRLVFAAEAQGLDRAAKRQKLLGALHHGHVSRVEQLLEMTPDLGKGDLQVACSVYDLATVRDLLEAEPDRAVEDTSGRRPILWLAGSRWLRARPELEADMLAIAELLLANGADVNDGVPWDDGHKLSALYLAIGHSNNMPLGRWLLEHGADPNDNESLYHATELGHHEGLKMLLEHGADPAGTNALQRAMDFDDIEAVRMILEAGGQAEDFNPAPVGGELPWVRPALHQAARRMCSPEMVELLLEAGADPDRKQDGMTPYAMARAFGNRQMASLLEKAGAATELTPTEAALAALADGETDVQLTDDALPEALKDFVRTILHLPGKLDHVKRLVEAGLDYDKPDSEGLTAVQVAGWEGLPEVMGYFLSLGADLTHVNGYGGTLFSTILHGSENNPSREGRDYESCLRLALEAGVDLPRHALQAAGVPELAAFLVDWAETYPEQVVDHGVV